MGQCFSTPLTKEDLKDALNPIYETLLAPKGNKLGKETTVAIFSEGSSSATGHGAVIEIGGELYLITAAHVLTVLCAGHSSEGGSIATFSLKWCDGTKVEKVNGISLYIPQDYVRQGNNDVGCLLIDRDSASLPLDKKALNFVEPGRIPLGNCVVGHGFVLIRGAITAMDTTPTSTRFLVQSLSAPGCSGCPLFLENLALAGLVHGPVRHRIGHHAHNDDVSSFVYADCIHGIELHLVPDDSGIREMLDLAENVPRNIAKEPDTPLQIEGLDRRTGLPDLWEKLGEKGARNHSSEQRSLNNIMRDLSDHIWPAEDDVEHERLTLSEGAVICFPRKEKTGT